MSAHMEDAAFEREISAVLRETCTGRRAVEESTAQVQAVLASADERPRTDKTQVFVNALLAWLPEPPSASNVANAHVASLIQLTKELLVRKQSTLAMTQC